MKLSIVTTTFNSSLTIDNFIKKIISSIDKIEIKDYEIIIIDDGSSDNTIERILKLKETNNKILLVELSRNFGHHKALMTGVKFSSGDYTYVVDSDLEEDPENLEIFFKKICNSDFDIVYGIQKKRSHEIFANIFGWLFYKVFNFLSNSKIPENVMTMTIFNKKVSEELKKYNEIEVFFHGLIHTIGFKKFSYNLDKKYKGKSEYSFRKKLDLFIEAIVSFSTIPLKFIFSLGIIISTISFFYFFYILINKIIYETVVPGYTSLMMTVIFFGGLIISGLGIIGIYLSKIYAEVKKRPQTIVKKVY